jgi:hypothetical protein
MSARRVIASTVAAISEICAHLLDRHVAFLGQFHG